MLFYNSFADAVDAVAGSDTQAVATTAEFDWQAIWKTVSEWCITIGIKLLLAILVLIIGFKVINFVMRRIEKRFSKKNVDLTITRVFINFTRVVLKVCLIALAVSFVGVQTASISAVILSLGTGISLAVQGTLSNFAGGVIIVVMRPFKLGDFITTNGQSGTVEDIKLFYTHIVTPDNKEVIIPNGALANNVIVNVSAKDTRRVDLIAYVSYGANLKLAKEVLTKLCNECPYTLAEKAPLVEVANYGDSSVDFNVRIWVKREDYWNAFYYMQAEMKNVLDENHIEIPFNQLDVHITKD